VRAVIGENGAGKSTLLKILSGVYPPSRGTLRLNSENVQLRDPADARARGISIVYQDLNLLPMMSVADNILLGREPRWCLGVVKRRELLRKARAVLRRMDVDLDLHALVSTLSPAECQMVAIARALSTSPSILVLDEPTARLDIQDVRRLFDIVRTLNKAEGVTIIFISHRVEEVFEICDSITILKDGQQITTVSTKDTNKDQAIELMVGRKLTSFFPAHSNVQRGKPVFSVQHLSSPDGTFEDVSLDVHEGEIVTLAGLRGQGQKRIVRAVFGILPKKTGEILLQGKKIAISGPRDAVRHGLSFLSDKRQEEGLIFPRSVAENLTLVALGGVCTCGVIRKRSEVSIIEDLIQKYDIHPPLPRQEIRHLSGGNQQKVAFAKWSHCRPRVMICDDPTAGIDAETKANIYRYLRQAADEGVAILIVSSDMLELLGLSDHIYVINRGRVAAQFSSAEATEEAIIRAAI
jgi:ABC-type sugar transport system ATPase subunit